MEEKFEKEIEELINNNFNINLFGPSGCGKTYLITKILNQRYKSNEIIVRLTLSDFFSSKNIFTIVKNKIVGFIRKYKKKNDFNYNVNKWYDLYQFFDFLTSMKHFSFYFLIDGIVDMESFVYFKKHLIKFFVSFSSCPNMKVLLISNFDITNSEIQYDYDFSSFISIQFPTVTKEKIKTIIKKSYSYKYYDSEKFDEIVETCINNFQYNFTNINEILFNVNYNLKSFRYITSCSQLTQFLIKTKYDKFKSKKKNNQKSKEEDNDKDNDSLKKSDNAENEKNFIKKQKVKKKENNFKDIYTYNNTINFKAIPYTQKDLRDNIKKQIVYAPIHIMKLESFFEKKNIFSNENNDNEDSNNEYLDEENFQKEKNKNLTESLSESQKFLLLASYLANETSIKNDSNIFKIKSRKNR